MMLSLPGRAGDGEPADRDLSGVRCLLFHCARYNKITPAVTMGLWHLADGLSRNGFETRIIHTGLEEAVHQEFKLRRYLHAGILLAGASAHWFPMTPESLDLLKAIKKNYPAVFTLLGGYSASYYAREIMENYPWIDGIIRGDAEKPLPDLAGALERREKDLSGIPNLLWRDQGRIVDNQLTFLCSPSDLENVELGNMQAYLNNYPASREYQLREDGAFRTSDFLPGCQPPPFFYLLTEKGCAGNCTICGGGSEAQQLINHRKGCMLLPASKVIQTLKRAIAQGFSSFLIDTDPVLHEAYYLKLASCIARLSRPPDISIGSRRLPSAAFIRQYKQVTCRLEVGLSPESIVEDLRRLNKANYYYTNSDLFASIEFLYSQQVYCSLYFCYFLPFSSIAELEETRRAFWELNARYPHYVEAYYIKISTDPGSPLFLKPEKYDISLEIRNLAEHLAACRKIESGENLLVHRVNTVPEDYQRSFHRRILWDTGVKRLLNIYVKYCIRAFPSVADWVAFLDRFYQVYALVQTGNTAETGPGRGEIREHFFLILAESAAFAVKKDPRIAPYLLDLLEYVRQLEGIKEKAPVTFSSPPPREGEAGNWYIRSAPHLALICLEFDIHTAARALCEGKAFEPIARKPIRLLFYKKAPGPGGQLLLEPASFKVMQHCLDKRSACLEEILEEICCTPREAVEVRAFLRQAAGLGIIEITTAVGGKDE